MKSKLNVNNIEVFLDYEELENAVSGLKDLIRNASIFHELSKSESEIIRVTVAGKESLTPITVKRLAKDHAIEVLRTLVKNCDAFQHLENKDVKHLLDTRDLEICLEIADNLEQYVGLMDVNALCERLLEMGPEVRASLADQCFTPIPILLDLAEDRDIAVRDRARETLGAMQIEDVAKHEKARNESKNDNKICCFCGKDESEVGKLIAGPGVFICDECVNILWEILNEKRKGQE